VRAGPVGPRAVARGREDGSMLEFLEIVAVFLVAVAMSFSLAHAAELPGKMRLAREGYLTVQPIYYAGFTLGALSEPAAILATLALLVVRRSGGGAAWGVAAALLLLVAMHAVYWIVTHPVNNFWLRDQELTGAGAGFFAFASRREPGSGPPRAEDWKALRNRWEYSHVARAALAMTSLIVLLVAVTS
jgi:hypothetical protein